MLFGNSLTLQFFCYQLAINCKTTDFPHRRIPAITLTNGRFIKGRICFIYSSLSIMTTFLCDYTCKYNAFIFIVYGYNHKNYDFNKLIWHIGHSDIKTNDFVLRYD